MAFLHLRRALADPSCQLQMLQIKSLCTEEDLVFLMEGVRDNQSLEKFYLEADCDSQGFNLLDVLPQILAEIEPLADLEVI
jgi:hypothetical protein